MCRRWLSRGLMWILRFFIPLTYSSHSSEHLLILHLGAFIFDITAQATIFFIYNYKLLSAIERPGMHMRAGGSIILLSYWMWCVEGMEFWLHGMLNKTEEELNHAPYESYPTQNFLSL